MNKSRQFFRIALIMTTGLFLGYFVGIKTRMRPPQIKILRTEQNKINEALELINRNYVDTVDIKRLSESAVEKIIGELDPHSSYLPASDVEAANEDLGVSFGGIGIEFNLVNDTIIVFSVISDGPAEKAGLRVFDRILTVNDSVIAGKKLGTTKIMRMLRGPKESKVMLGIQRGNSEELTSFELTRGDIPNNTIDVSYKISDRIGYINITKFARSTYSEFLTAIAKLKEEGVTGFIIDLRFNPGGYMEPATYMVNEFLPRGNMIVYLEGKAYPRSETHSNGKGACQEEPVVVLINEYSGSASEIFAGAIQDNDRGLIIGRRSYGKGVVQSRFELSDKSELQLTMARYYTPSGRCIQKEYELGKSEEYGMDIYNRYSHGEFFTADSIKMNDSLVYYTAGGRTVYGGGGIMPDIFIPSDTTGWTSYFQQIDDSGALYQFTLDYSNKNQEILKKFSDYKALHEYLKRQPILHEFVDYAASKGIRKRTMLIEISKNLIESRIHAYIVRNFFNKEGYYPVVLPDDPTVVKAIEVIEKDIWKPETYIEYKKLETEDNSLSTTGLSVGKISKHFFASAC